MGKASLYSENTNPATGDFALGETTAGGPNVNRFKYLNLIKLFFQNPPTGNTGFAGLVQAYTPTVSALSSISAGTPTGFYMDLFGIKLCWGHFPYSTTGGANGHAQLTLPPSNFFTTVQAYLPAVSSEGNYAFQFASGDSIQGGSPPTAFDFYISDIGAGGGGAVDWFIIGT